MRISLKTCIILCVCVCTSIYIFLFSALFLFSEQRNLSCLKDKTLIVQTFDYCGFFASFKVVLGSIHLYEKGVVKGVKVDFVENGPYYQNQQGKNWWSYYFKPIDLGNTEKPYLKTAGVINGFFNIWKYLDKCNIHDVNNTLRKYVDIKDHILNKIDFFYESQFEDKFVIGVHYRGTDKIKEAPRIPYELVFNEINKTIANLEQDDFKIFIATDEENFLNEALKIYPNIITRNVKRSKTNQPIHFGGGYLAGEEALIDCVLLSKCDILIRTESHLSDCCKYFSPHQKSILAR